MRTLGACEGGRLDWFKIDPVPRRRYTRLSVIPFASDGYLCLSGINANEIKRIPIIGAIKWPKNANFAKAVNLSTSRNQLFFGPFRNITARQLKII
jgi:hypothetical protein